MNKRFLSGILAVLMLMSCLGVCAEEATVPDTTVTAETITPTDGAASDTTTDTTAPAETTPAVDPSSPDYTNLDITKGDLIFRGNLLLNADGGRADSLDEAVNLPEDFYTSPEYLATLTETTTKNETTAVSSFPDVETTHTNYAAIEEMKKKGYIVGYEDGTFRPANNVTRAEFVKVLIEKDGGIASVSDSDVSGFTDVDTNPPHWAQKYIILGVKKGYLDGMGDGTFAPDATITYEQAMKILVCHFGKEVSAKSIASSVLPLWPNAYVVTGEKMEMHLNTGLSMGKLVNRAQFAQMLSNGIKTVNTKVNNPVNTGGGGGTGGGPGGSSTTKDEDDESVRVTGVIVSTEGILIDPNTEMITSPAYIMLRYVESRTGETKYVKLREPYDASNRAGKNMYKSYLGYEVTIKYEPEEDYLAIKTLKASDTSKKTVINAEDIKYSETLASLETDDLQFHYKVDKKSKTINLPENLDDMAVVYNGVTIDAQHPSYDHDFENDTTYIKITDLLPQNGTVTFINRDGGNVELAIVETYDTLVPKSGAVAGVVTDKYDSGKKYTLDSDRLLSDLQSVYGDHRTLSSGDIEITLLKKTGAGSALTEAVISNIRTKTALTIYASRDLTKIEVQISSSYVGTSSTTGTQVTTGYDGEDKAVKLGTSTCIVSDYLINNVANGKYEDVYTVSELFPLGEYVVAYQDVNGEIVDIEIKEPTYTYGYLVDIDYEEANSAENAYFTFRIITKDNVTKYATPENQTFTVRANGKIKVNGTEYRHDTYDELAEVLAANARIINYGDPGKGVARKEAEMIVHATYAQPIRFVKGSTATEIKTILTMTPSVAFTEESETYTCSKAYYIGNELVGTNAVIFSVPDDRYDYDRYEIKARSYIAAYKSFNPEIYQEETSTGTVNNCIVLYDEGITGRPSIDSKISIVKSIEYYDTIDEENIYKVVVYQPSSITAKSEVTIYITETERDETTDVNGVEKRFEPGDVIVYGTTKINSLNAIKNAKLVVDLSDREKLGFSAKYDRYGEESESDSPYYWFRYGTVIDFDPDSDTMYLDVGEDDLMLIQGTGLFFSSTNSNTLCKPVYFFANEDDKGDIAHNTGERFSIYTLNEMVQPGDMMFLYSTGTSGLQKVVYLIPGTDRDEVYPRSTTDTTTATVTVKVATEGASVTLDGTEVSVENGEAVFENVSPDVYSYEVNAPNHKEYKGRIIIRNGVLSYTITAEDGNPIELERYTGGALFKVTPGNATVTVEGRPPVTGNNTDEPLIATFSRLEVDTQYSYTVEAEGYETVTGSFTVEENEQTVNVDVEMVPILYTVSISINSSVGAPASAIVTIGDESVTVTDGVGTVQLAAGDYNYNVEADGFEFYEGTVTVVPDEENEISVTLLRMFATVTFTLPEGTISLTVGGVEVPVVEGTATVENVVEGTSFTVTAEGVSEYTREVDSENITVSFT